MAMFVRSMESVRIWSELCDPGLGPFRVREDPVNPFEVCLLVLFEPCNGLLRELDPALCLFEVCYQLQVVGPALLVDEIVDICKVGLEVGKFVLLDAPVGLDPGDFNLLFFGRRKERSPLLLLAPELGGGPVPLVEAETLLPLLVFERMFTLFFRARLPVW